MKRLYLIDQATADADEFYPKVLNQSHQAGGYCLIWPTDQRIETMTAPTVPLAELKYHQLGVTSSVLAHWECAGGSTNMGGRGGGGG